jgi:hypothetical protein
MFNQKTYEILLNEAEYNIGYFNIAQLLELRKLKKDRQLFLLGFDE